jgi:predicted outer membrane protein
MRNIAEPSAAHDRNYRSSARGRSGAECERDSRQVFRDACSDVAGSIGQAEHGNGSRADHQANLMEVELAKMAREKGSINGVRAYADQLIQDHTSLDQTVVAMAQKGGNLKAVRRSAHETADEKTVERKLKSANGAKFDKLFLQQASSDHERLIRRLQQDREDASDEDLEALIDKTIPILEQHKELAQILMNKEQASGQADQTHG